MLYCKLNSEVTIGLAAWSICPRGLHLQSPAKGQYHVSDLTKKQAKEAVSYLDDAANSDVSLVDLASIKAEVKSTEGRRAY